LWRSKQNTKETCLSIEVIGSQVFLEAMSVRISVDRVKGFALIVSVRIEPSTDVYIYKLHNKRIKELKKTN
jgi:uncharacterized protein YabN with tetrapyrrole methylase and pyrophosphatase domain